VTIPLQHVTVAVGPNNAGKSNLVNAFRFLQAVATGASFEEAARRMSRSLAELPFNGQTGLPVKLAVTACDQTSPTVPWSDVRYLLAVDASAVSPRQGERFTATPKQGPLENHQSSNMPCSQVRTISSPCAQDFMRQLAAARFFHFVPAALRSPSPISREPKLEEDGTGLPALLEYLQSEQRDVFEKVEESFREYVPEVERVCLRTVDGSRKTVLLKERGFTDPFPAQVVSDGVLLFLALLCCVHTRPKPSLIVLEEPEHGVHPRRLKDVVEFLYHLSQEKDGDPAPQILVTTHSPYLLDQFKDDLDAVLVLERRDGATSVNKASAAIEKAGGLHASPLGEVWYSGILGGVPA
jgi:predicted ATPase